MENTQSEHPEPSFEAKNAALANEWPRIMLYADDSSRDTNDLHRTDYGVDEGYEYKSESRGLKGCLERLSREGVTPENHEVAKALKRLHEADEAFTAHMHGENNDSDVAANFEEAREAMKDIIEKYQPIVTGAY